MRKIVAGLMVSVDGVVEAPETWTGPYFIPEIGQVFSFYGFKFEVLRKQRNQIVALRITPPKRQPEDDSG